MKDIAFEERAYSEESKKWTYYFIAPPSKILEMFPGRYRSEDVVSTELSIEVPCNEKNEYEFGNLDGVVVSISPTSKEEDGYCDYDWKEIGIPEFEIMKLLETAMRQACTFDEYWNSGLIIKDLCAHGQCVLCDEIIERISETSFEDLTCEEDDMAEHAKQLYKCSCSGNHSENAKVYKAYARFESAEGQIGEPNKHD